MVTPETEQAFLEEILRGHTAAIDAARTLFAISQTMDDIIDKDRPLTTAEIAMAFYDATVTLAGNSFYIEHLHVIAPTLCNVFADYVASVELERLSPHDRSLAFVLRDSLTSIVTLFACIIGGHAYGLSVAARVRQFFHDETLEDYLRGLA